MFSKIDSPKNKRQPQGQFKHDISESDLPKIVQLQKALGNRVIIDILKKRTMPRAASATPQKPIQCFKGKIRSVENNYIVVDDESGAQYSVSSDDIPFLNSQFISYSLDYEVRNSNEAFLNLRKLTQEQITFHKSGFEKNAREENDETRARKLLAVAHVNESNDNEELRHHLGHIKNGAFTNKRDEFGKISVSESIAKRVISNMTTFYFHAEQLKQKYANAFDASEDLHITLYRAFKSSLPKGPMVDALPSSATMEIDFAKKWLEGPDKGFILEISLPITHGMLFMAYPSDFEGLPYPEPINQEQGEVTIAPSQLTITGERSSGDYKIYTAKAKEIGHGEAVKRIWEDVNNQEYPFTLEEMFEYFKKSFQKEAIVRNYLNNDLQDLFNEKCTVELNESADKQSTKVYLNDKKDEYTLITLTLEDNQIVYEYVKTGEEGESQRYVYNKKYIAKIYKSLKELTVESDDIPLDLPGPIYDALYS